MSAIYNYFFPPKPLEKQAQGTPKAGDLDTAAQELAATLAGKDKGGVGAASTVLTKAPVTDQPKDAPAPKDDKATPPAAASWASRAFTYGKSWLAWLCTPLTWCYSKLCSKKDPAKTS